MNTADNVLVYLVYLAYSAQLHVHVYIVDVHVHVHVSKVSDPGQMSFWLSRTQTGQKMARPIAGRKGQNKMPSLLAHA